ncbi:MAG: PAS domain S-box protein [Lacibacter sp.]
MAGRTIKKRFPLIYCTSIKKFGKVVGGFTLYAPVSHFFDEHVIRLLTEAAHDIGHCLEVIETEKQRRNNEMLLNEKEAINQAHFNTNPNGIILGSPEGTIYYANKAACSLLGYSEEEILQVNRAETVDLSDHRFHQSVKDVLEKGWARAEFNFRHKDGTKIPCDASASVFITPDGKSFASIIFQDIRERVNREKLINDYRYAIDQSSLVDISNKEGLITYVNENFCKTTKYSPEELLGKNQRMLNSGYHPKKMFTELWRTILKGEVWRGEVRDKAKDGSIFWVQTTIVPFKNSNGEIEQFLSIRKDITAGKEAEELIQIANERYEIINSATRDIIWEKDFIHNKTVYNNGITTMLGYNLKEIDDINTWWEQNVHPEDFERIAKNLNDVIKRQQKFVVEEYRLRCADGSYKYISDRVSVFYDDEGKLKRLIGIMQDVTEAKEGEKHLLKAIIEAQEKERLQLGMELHDNIKQILAATKLNLEMALHRIDKKELVTDVLTRSVGYINNSIQELRRLSHQLAPTFDEAFHLKDSITNMIINMDPEKQLKVTVHVDQQNEEIYNAFQTTIFRIVQEQFTNILKHAKATAVHISISLIESNICLNVKDNGIGFDSSVKKEGIGIENIRRRVQFFDGEFRLHTSAGAGCEIDIILPLKTDQPVA